MKEGMLWLDDSKQRPLTEKVKRAAAYFEKKYQRKPNLCQVNHEQLAGQMVVDGVTVKPVSNVLLHHFWLGVTKP